MSEDSNDDAQQPRRPRGVIAAAVFLVVLLGAVIVYRIDAGTTPDQADASPQPSQSASSGSPSAPVSTAIPTTPPQVSWELVGGIAVPASDSAGPTRSDPPVYAGFAHSPTGALLAVAQIPPRLTVAPGDQWRAIVKAQTMPGAGREAYEQARAKVTTPSPPPRLGYGQFVAYRFVSYSPDTAVIAVVHEFKDGTRQANTSTLRWWHGDWRLQFTDDGLDGGPSTRVETLTGYVEFRGV